jgi:hypothetical protein
VGKPPEGIFFLRLEAAEEKQITDRRMESAVPNLYVFPRNGDPIFSPLMKLKKGKLSINQDGRRYRLKNVVSAVCLLVHGIAESIGDWVFIVWRCFNS